LSKPLVSRPRACVYIPLLTLIAAALLLTAPAKPRAAAPATTAATSPVRSNYAALPLAFERNQGQTDAQVKYLARGRGYTLFLTPGDAVFALQPASSKASHADLPEENQSAVVRMRLVGANSNASISAENQLPGISNYFLGSDPGKWRTNIPHFGRVSYQNVYPGVDLAFHGAQRQVEFDFVLAPAADPSAIAFQFNGAQSLKTDDFGDLVVASGAGNVTLHRPVAYQELNGARQPVEASFVLAANQVSLKLGNYDHNRELVIDPSVSYAYSTYLGGSGDDEGFGIAFDSSGNAYVTGQTASTDFPVTAGVAQGTLKGASNVFVSKISADGTTLSYSTFVGGTGVDSGNAIAVDPASGVAYVAGGTSSTDFPTTPGAFQTTNNSTSSNAFAFELNAGGTALVYSTYVGGTGLDVAVGIALATDSSGDVFIAGKTSSSNFPTHSPLQSFIPGSVSSGFLTKLNASGTALVYSTYIGGSTLGDAVGAVAVDSSNNAYVTGQTFSTAFTVTGGAFQPTCGSCTSSSSNAFVTAVNAAGSGYVYSSFLGSSGSEVGNGIAVDASGNAYVTGSTTSTSFPTTTGAFQTASGGSTDAFVTKVNAQGSALSYSTYLGGSSFDTGAAIAVDSSGNAYVTGQTNSSPFPTASPTQATFGGDFDAFVSVLNATGTQLIFSTYLGGSGAEDVGGNFGAIAVDSAGANIYVTGNTAPPPPPGTANNFPVQTGGFQTTGGGGADAFVVKYSQATSPSFTLSATGLLPGTVSPGGSATSTVTVTSSNGFAGTVTLACTVSPAVTLGPTCSGSATNTTPGTLTVSTTAATARLQHAVPGSAGWFYAMLLPIAGISLAGVKRAGSRRSRLFGLIAIGLMLGALMILPACGGSSSHSGGGGSSGTPAGTYTITVTGTASGATQNGTSPTLSLTVN